MRKMTARLLVVVVLAGVGAALLAQTPLGTGFTFQGRVKQAGQLVNDSCDFEFTLWDAATDGGQVGPTLTFDAGNALPVNQGLFSAKLDFGAAALNGDQRWLEVAVGCPSGQPLIPVSPRQEITAAPYAAFSLSGKPPSSLDAPDGDPLDALIVDDNGNVGIGTANPASPLHVMALGDNSTAVSIEANGGIARLRLLNGSTTWALKMPGSFGTDITFRDVGVGKDRLNLKTNGDVLMAWESGGGNVGIGTSTPQAKLDVDGEIKGFGVVPIGSIVAWHKSFANTPGLPSGWQECNGQMFNDIESPYDGQTLPDLNDSRRFLRGGSSSGTLEADASQGHKHHVDTDAGTELRASGGGANAWGSSVLNRDPSDAGRYKAQNPITDGINGTPRTANETRPVNMSVVWIMRVK